jgi:hypothetical protein
MIYPEASPVRDREEMTSGGPPARDDTFDVRGASRGVYGRGLGQ